VGGGGSAEDPVWRFSRRLRPTALSHHRASPGQQHQCDTGAFLSEGVLAVPRPDRSRQYQQHRRPRPAGLTRWIRLIRWIEAPGGYRIHRISHFHRISAPRAAHQRALASRPSRPYQPARRRPRRGTAAGPPLQKKRTRVTLMSFAKAPGHSILTSGVPRASQPGTPGGTSYPGGRNTAPLTRGFPGARTRGEAGVQEKGGASAPARVTARQDREPWLAAQAAAVAAGQAAALRPVKPRHCGRLGIGLVYCGGRTDTDGRDHVHEDPGRL
jgi:hypothetical protein